MPPNSPSLGYYGGIGSVPPEDWRLVLDAISKLKPTSAQAAYLGSAFVPGMGIAEATGAAPEFPTSEMSVSEWATGPRAPSFPENIRRGEYLDAALQGIGTLGDLPLVLAATPLAPVGAALAGTIGAIPRVISRSGKAIKRGIAAIPASPDRKRRATQQGFDTDQTLYHGSTHDIQAFGGDANPENYFGKGHYLTDTPEDASINYAGVGPDLRARMEQRTEQIRQTLDNMTDAERVAFAEETKLWETLEMSKGDTLAWMSDWDVVKERGDFLPMKIATKSLTGSAQEVVYPVYTKMKKPFDLSSDSSRSASKDTFLRYERKEFDPKDYLDEAGGDMDVAEDLANADYYAHDPEGELVDFIDSLKNDPRIGDDRWDLIEKLDQAAIDGGGLSAHEIDNIMRNTEWYAAAELEDGTAYFANSEVYRTAIENAGYDGIIHDASWQAARPPKFRMPGVDPETKHYIVFEPENIRSINAKFDPEKVSSKQILAGTGIATIGAATLVDDQKKKDEAGAI